MPGNKNSPYVNSQRPYVRWQKDGKSLDKDGNSVSADSPDAHIPLDEFKYKNNWLMEISPERRKIINIMELIKQLSSKEFQMRVWVRGEGPEESSYIELMSQLFDDNDFDNIIDENGVIGYRFSEELHEKLKDLRDRLNDFDGEGRSHEDIVRDPLWGVIRNKASEIVPGLEKEILRQ